MSINPAHYIPLSRDAILSAFINELDGIDPHHMRTFFTLIKNQIHLEFHEVIEKLDNSYEPFNPNITINTQQTFGTKKTEASDTQEKELDSSVLTEHLQYALTKANYTELHQDQLDEAFKEASLFKIQLHVDFSDYKKNIIFTRGESVQKETVYFFGRFIKKEIEFINYHSVVIFLHFKNKIVNPTLKNACKPGSVVLKMFHNVPKADLEMLFPNTKIRMRLKDKLMIGIPAAISGGIIIATKLGTSLLLLGALISTWLGFNDEPVTLNKTSLLVLLAGFGTLGGYIWKQFNGFKVKKLKFSQSLTENLYFKNTDNNEGVYYRLIHEAEKEECKEVLLAYFYLLSCDSPKSKKEIDISIESWVKKTWNFTINFDVDDAIFKLNHLEIIEQHAGGYTAKGIEQAIKILDKRWDNYFSS